MEMRERHEDILDDVGATVLANTIQLVEKLQTSLQDILSRINHNTSPVLSEIRDIAKKALGDF